MIGLILTVLISLPISAKVLVNLENPLMQLTRAEAYYVLTGRIKEFSDGSRIDIIMIPRSERAFRLTASLFGMSPLQFQRVLYKVAKRYRARILYVKDEAMAIQVLRENLHGLTVGIVVRYGTHEVKIVQ